MRPGSRVRVHSVRSRPELNGIEASLLHWVPPKQRWAIEVVRTGECIQVKPANLLLCPCTFHWLHGDCLVRVLAWVPHYDAAWRASCHMLNAIPSADVQAERRRCATTVALVALGGSVTDWPECQKYPQRQLASLSCYALVDGRWRGLTKLPFARVGSRGAMLREQCYLVGGYDPEEDVDGNDEDALADIRWFDLATGRWSQLSVPTQLTTSEQLQELRFGPAVAACRGTLYIFFETGGLAYEPSTSDWRRIAARPADAMPCMREVACALGHAIYLAGGIDRESRCDSRQLWRFRLADGDADGTWERRADMPGNGRSDAVAVSMDGLLYVIGGQTCGRNEDAMLIYDPTKDEWRTTPPIPVPLCGYPNPREQGYGRLSATAYEGTVVVMGSGPPATYCPATGAWLEPPSIPSITLSMGEYVIPEGHAEMHPAESVHGIRTVPLRTLRACARTSHACAEGAHVRSLRSQMLMRGLHGRRRGGA